MTGAVGAPSGQPDLCLAAPFRAIAYDELGSTNDEAKRLAAQGADHGCVIWARRQVSGRGRLDRRWASLPGNLFVSFVLRPDVPSSRAAELGFVASLAVADTVTAFVQPEIRVGLKWPNDVLAQGSKIAGILLEAISDGGAIAAVILGIGINVAAAPEVTAYPATALHRLIPDAPGFWRPDVEAVLERLTSALAERLMLWSGQGFVALRQAWLGRSIHAFGQSLEVTGPTGPISGRFLDLDSDGALILETGSGAVRVTAGDVHFPKN
jgi:BirA family biotin operon repressor/biotin-[acetyl-CoA-carboxylase] ligase